MSALIEAARLLALCLRSRVESTVAKVVSLPRLPLLLGRAPPRPPRCCLLLSIGSRAGPPSSTPTSSPAGGPPMAWQKGTSDRARRLPPEWHRIRARVLRRDNYRCRAEMSTGYRCGEPANQVDHIIPGDDHSEANLQALCQWHHARKSSKEGADARGPRPSQRRQPEAHPGML